MKVLLGLRLRHFTPRQHLPDVQITPQEWKPDPGLGVKHDDLWAEAWESDYERPTFDAEYDNTVPLKSTAILVLSNLPTEQTATHQKPHETVPPIFLSNWTNYVP